LLEHLEHDLERLPTQAVHPRAPSLVVWGANDTVFPIAVGRRLAQDLDAELVVIEGARHMPNAEHPQRFNRVVLRFLA
jgi:pimeloyl-ACP methyl ester carboxylesterase